MMVLLLPTSCCEENPVTSRQELLTSTWWSLTEDCGAQINCGESCALGFSPNGYCTDYYGYFGGAWSLKDNDAILIIDQEEYKILKLTETALEFKKNWLLGCRYSYESISMQPKVETQGVSDITQTSAKFRGLIRTDKTSLTPMIDYGPTILYGQTLTINPIVPRVSLYGYVNQINNFFSPGTTYHYRYKAVFGSETFYGQDLTLRTFNAATLSDVNGNVYCTVDIGTQVWMAENLRVTKYNDGKSILLVTDNTTWGSLTVAGYCWRDNDSVTYKNTDGALYNWYVVNTGKLCPIGWHVPSDQDWTTLEQFLGEDFCSKMVEGWTNESGFSGIYAGYRTENGSFSTDTGWWSSTEENSNNAWVRGCDKRSWSKKSGIPIRCIKDI
jgi:uncharacterized protein (TIGR02145 family)